MARCAARDGITAIVCTPHMDTFGNTAVALSRHALVRKALQERLNGEGIPLHLYGGAEWMVSEELVNVLQDLPEGRLARSDTFLFELSVFMQPAVIGRLLFAARLKGLTPLWAHPERHPAMMGHEELAQPVVDAGGWLQLTSGSLTGFFGKDVRRCAEALCTAFSGRVLLGSDAHDAERRVAELQEGYAALNALSPDSGDKVRQINGPPPARYYLRKERESSWKSRKGRGRCKRRRPKKRGCWK